MHVLLDLLADPVCLALGDAYVGYEENSCVYVGSMCQNRIDVCLPGGFSCAEVGHAETHLTFAEDEYGTAHDGFDDVGCAVSDLA